MKQAGELPRSLGALVQEVLSLHLEVQGDRRHGDLQQGLGVRVGHGEAA